MVYILQQGHLEVQNVQVPLLLSRTVNLRYNQDIFGATKIKTGPSANDLVYKIFRSEGTYRAFGFWFVMGFISVFIYTYDKLSFPEDKAAIKEKLEQERSKIA